MRELVNRDINTAWVSKVISAGIYTNLISLWGNEDWLGRVRMRSDLRVFHTFPLWELASGGV